MLLENFWDSRYSGKKYAYGIEPNTFFQKQIREIPVGNILLPAEGEGRNAVFAASLGWKVTAYDSSIEGKRKAEELALKNNVVFNYLLTDHENFSSQINLYDCITLIYVHMPEPRRNITHQKLLTYLKPGGTLILEGFSKNQINNNSGGPKGIEMLFSKEELIDDFSSMREINIYEKDILLDEGSFHQGNASVIRLIGQK